MWKRTQSRASPSRKFSPPNQANDMDQPKAHSWPQRSEPQPTLNEDAIAAATFLVGCYRTGEASDPDTYFRALAALLGSYPTEVIHAVVDPRCGIPAQSQWLPTLAEVKAACEREMEPVYREREYQRRRSDLARALPPPPSGDRPTIDQLKAQYGECWGIKQDDDGPRFGKKWEPPSLEKMCADAGIAPDEFEAINAEAVKWEKLRAPQR